MKLFYNAKFYSMRKENEFYTAILIENDKIIETFKKTPELQNIEKIDLGNGFVYPGFIDTHTHSFEGGLYSLSADLENVTSLNDVFDILAETEPISEKIFAFHFDENKIEEKRFPTNIELDRIFPDTPAILRRVDGHSSVINTIAAERIDWKTPLPGNFCGHLNKGWNGTASTWFHRGLTDETILDIYHEAAKKALKKGHTTIHTMIGDAHSDLMNYRLIKKNLAKFPIEFVLYPQITDIKQALEIGSPRIGGCIVADGSFGSHTAALLKPYKDQPENYGALYKTDKFWEDFIREAHRKNLQIAIHCIGDAAISQILNCYEKVQRESPKDLRHEIIHNELTSDEMLDRMQKINISSVMQPMFDRLWAGENGLYQRVLGKERTSRTNRFASIYQRGILITGGSDWYITDLNALKGINAAAKMHNKNERLTPYQAVELYTSNAAKLSFDENRLGALAKGFQADFVCLEEDIFQAEEIDKIKVKRVVKKGEIVL
ncbi:MAG: amidohydrolase [Candidatus Cloacimonetes bacterium]|nr:amidohydrolase [Candidatus Cloacimonadota bacterium]